MQSYKRTTLAQFQGHTPLYPGAVGPAESGWQTLNHSKVVLRPILCSALPNTGVLSLCACDLFVRQAQNAVRFSSLYSSTFEASLKGGVSPSSAA